VQTLAFDLEHGEEAAEPVGDTIVIDRDKNQGRQAETLKLIQKAIRTKLSGKHEE
jgi:hypothetical protein